MLNNIGTAQPSRSTQTQSRDKYDVFKNVLKLRYSEANNEFNKVELAMNENPVNQDKLNYIKRLKKINEYLKFETQEVTFKEQIKMIISDELHVMIENDVIFEFK